MFEAQDAAFFLVLGLAAWKFAEVVRSMVTPKPARAKPPKRASEVKAAKVAEVAASHFKSLDWCHTPQGTRLHLRDCHFLKGTDEVIETGSRRMKGQPHEVISRSLCTYCAVRLEKSLRIELEATH